MQNIKRLLQLSLLLLPAATHAASVTAPVIADATLTAVGIGGGAIATMQAGGGATALVRFRTQDALPTGTTPGNITRARLFLYVSRVTTAGSLDIRPVAGDWNESSTSAPALSPVFASVAVTAANTLLVVDVTTQLANALTAGQEFGFAIQAAAAAPSTDVMLDTKESGTTSATPRLEIVTDGPAGPTGDAGIMGAAGLAGLTGATGARGAQGPRGATGQPGVSGPTGSRGPTGPVGPRGNPAVETVSQSAEVLAVAPTLSSQASCPVGKKILSGACSVGNGVFGLLSAHPAADGSGWTCIWRNPDIAFVQVQLNASALCARVD